MVQAEIETRGTTRSVAHDDRGPKGLLRKIATGFGVLDDDAAPAPVSQQRVPAQQQTRIEPRPQPQLRPVADQAHGRVDDNPYAPRRGALDRTGRINTAERAGSEDDQFEIPAFLRRQSN
jgi:cell division protein FtsZ